MAETDCIELTIASTEGTLFSGRVAYVMLPGSAGPFAVYADHAPLLSTLDRGVVEYSSGGKVLRVNISDGFVDVLHNVVSVCVTSADEEKGSADVS